MMPGEEMESNMIELPDNIKTELAKRVESKLMGVHVLSSLKMIPLTSCMPCKRRNDRKSVISNESRDLCDFTDTVLHMVLQG
jgi:hypothetical protein